MSARSLSVSQEPPQIKMERWICWCAGGPVVLARCTFGLSLLEAPRVCVTGNSRVLLYVVVQSDPPLLCAHGVHQWVSGRKRMNKGNKKRKNKVCCFSPIHFYTSFLS